MIYEFYGDLITYAKNGTFDIIGHGCNCFNTMGAGIAKQIAINFPENEVIDKKTEYGDKNKLGTVQIHMYKVRDRNWRQGFSKDLAVANMYTQYEYYSKSKKVCVDYEAIEKCLVSLIDICKENNWSTIGIPKIGAGLAGGDWNKIYSIIDKHFSNNKQISIVIVNYKAGHDGRMLHKSKPRI